MFNRILVPVDVEQPSSWERALPVGLQLAKDYDAELHVVTVVPAFGMSVVGSYFPADFEKKAITSAKRRLEDIINAAVPGEDIKMHVAHGTIYEELLAAAETLGVDLIVMSSHRPELKDYLIGPNAARVVRHATQSVFVVRDRGSV
jgi:nucleotide-binding universal stress UspA family protein